MDPKQHCDDKEAWKEQKQWFSARVHVVNAPLAKLIEQDLVLASKNLDFFDDKWLHATLALSRMRRKAERGAWKQELKDEFGDQSSDFSDSSVNPDVNSCDYEAIPLVSTLTIAPTKPSMIVAAKKGVKSSFGMKPRCLRLQY